MYINSSNIEINRNPNFDMSLWYNYSSQYTSFFVNSLTHLLSCLWADPLQLTWHILHIWWCVVRDAFNHFTATKQNSKLNYDVEPFHMHITLTQFTIDYSGMYRVNYVLKIHISMDQNAQKQILIHIYIFSSL